MVYKIVCVSDVNVELFLDVNLLKLKQFAFWSSKQYTSLLSCEKIYVSLMTNIWKVPFVIYTSSQNVGWCLGLRILMTYKVFTDIKYLCYINWSFMTLLEPSNEECTVFINKSGGSLTINFPLSICLLASQLLHFLSLFINELQQ